MLAEERAVTRHQAVRADFHLRHVVDVEPRQAGLSRAEKQRDILAPGHVGRLEEAQALAPEAHELRELLGLARAKRDPAIHVDAAQHEAGVHAVVDVPLIDVVVELGASAGEHVPVARRIDDNFRAQRLPPRFALEQDARDAAGLHHRQRGPRMQHDANLLLQQHLLRKYSE